MDFLFSIILHFNKKILDIKKKKKKKKLKKKKKKKKKKTNKILIYLKFLI